jgi:hypothetical protein
MHTKLLGTSFASGRNRRYKKWLERKWWHWQRFMWELDYV